MPPEGADADEYLRAKYGLGPEQLAKNRVAIRARANTPACVDRRVRRIGTCDCERRRQRIADVVIA